MKASDLDDGTAYMAAKARESLTASVPEHIRVRNRRMRYLELHPEYFGPHLELADPLLYDRCVRRFQSSAEREDEGRKKGYSGVLEADLIRSEAKIAALKNPDPNSEIVYKRGAGGEILAEEKDEVPVSKADGFERWRYVMEKRFIEGRDTDFDYENVDHQEELDSGEQQREHEERWFDDQSPEWIDDGNEKGDRAPSGETGVQDF